QALRGPGPVPPPPPASPARSPSATARSATAARPASTAATRAGGLRIRDLHRDPAAVELAAVQLGDGRLGLLRRVHLDEPESPGLAREAIGDHGRGQDIATLCDYLTSPFARGAVRKTAYVEF